MIRPDLRDLINRHKPVGRLNNNNNNNNNSNNSNNNNNVGLVANQVRNKIRCSV